MRSAWEVLEEAGVPFGTRAGPPTLDDRQEIAEAVRQILRDAPRLSERQRICLLAWLRAWASGWPTSFASTFGPSSEAVLERAADGVEDRDRYLKLRRLATEQLARAL